MTRLQKIAAMLTSRKLDAVLITGEENTKYSTGFAPLEGMVFITADGAGYAFTDSRYIEDGTNKIAPNGFTVALAPDGYPKAARALCDKHGITNLAFEDSVISYAEYHRFADALSCKLSPIGDGFVALRAQKEQCEVDLIIKAQRISERALKETLPLIKVGMTEQELAAELDYRTAKHGSSGVSFSTIFVSGAKSSMPHGVPGDKKIENGDFITIDFGSIVDGYHSDMTRTVAVGFATDEMKTVYDTVRTAHTAGIDALNVGAIGRDVHNAAAKIIADAGYGPYFSHGLGHSLGLNIHENPGCSATSDSLMRVGTVMTIEPGIYLPGKFGVRIEDMVYLSEKGKVDLTEFTTELIIL